MSPKPLNVLYAIQGTGNGHLSRAVELVPVFQKYAHVSVLVSGIQSDLKAPFDVKYSLKGLSFIFGKNGGIDFWRLLKEVSFVNFLKEMKHLDLSPYDLVINDFEPVTSWASKRQKIPCIHLSHQAAVIHENAPKPKLSSWLGKFILRHYVRHSYSSGFHFKAYGSPMFTPVIRNEIRQLSREKIQNHFTVYLPAYSDAKLLDLLSQLPMYRWEVFSKKASSSYPKGNVQFHPVNGALFVKSMATARGVICGAGFETPAECLYLGKKLMVIPMHDQYEQQCNAQALQEMGITVLKRLDNKSARKIKEWIKGGKVVKMDYQDNVNEVVYKILKQAVDITSHN